MVAAIKQRVTVQEEGRIEVRSPQFHPGAVAEVIVLLEPQPSAPSLTALDQLQRSLELDPAGAQAWVEQVRAERAASPRPAAPHP